MRLKNGLYSANNLSMHCVYSYIFNFIRRRSIQQQKRIRERERETNHQKPNISKYNIAY